MIRQNQYTPSVVFHPGETLAEKLQEMGMGPKEFALRSGKPEKTINDVLHGDSSITPDMAVQFENATRIPAHFWMNQQRSYDEFRARERQQKVLEEAVAWLKHFPLADMVRHKWLPKVKTNLEKAGELLAFFGFANPAAWEDYYFNQQLKVAFRISLAHTKEPYAISAWLRRGELQAAGLDAGTYSEKKFKAALPAIKGIMAEHPAGFFHRLQEICLEAGVKVVHTPCVSKAPINGATRWINDTPVIQLSGRYKRNDIFWFTFFHEAGHLLLHGKKEIFLETGDPTVSDPGKEAEADQFAIRWVLSEEEEAVIVAEMPLSTAEILRFARRFHTHPAVIIGRLQHKRLIPHSFGKEFIESVVFD